MKYVSLLILLIFGLPSQGQNVKNFYLNSHAELGLSHIIQDLKKELSLPEDQDLKVKNKISYQNRVHYNLEHTLNGKIILNSGLNLHIYEKHGIYVQSYLLDCNYNASDLKTNLPFVIITPNGLEEVQKILLHQLEPQQWGYINEKGHIIQQHNRYLYFKDTTMKAKVFMVNPMNSANVTYGGSYVDNNDQSSPVLEDEQFQVDMHATFRNDSFFLEHDMFKFREISGPYYYDNYGTDTSVWDYDRSEQRFEAANAYYHLTSFHDYLVDLGFTALIKKVDIDVHAMGGSDNSQFDPSAYTIEFGDGGVDDAEDGEVIIHEYIHSISTTANYTANNGKERDAMEEGNCDYLAKSYSRSVNDNNGYMVFSWDGHNPFWGGFVINSADHYPEDLKNSKDGDRDMWSSTLMCIHDYIGREATDSLVIEHLSYQTQFGTMPEMAAVLLHLDTVLFNNRYYEPIKHCLVMRGLTTYGVSVDEKELENDIEVINSLAFSEGKANLEIKLKEASTLTIYNALGQEILTYQKVDQVLISPSDLPKGMYSALILSDSGQRSLKFVR